MPPSSLNLKVAFANSGSSSSLDLNPSSPPLLADPGSSEYKTANVENLSPSIIL